MAEKAEEPKKSEAEEILDMVNDPDFDWAGVGMIPHTQTQLEAALGLVHTDIAKQPTEPIPKIK